jgi:hypothetical protein
MAVKLFFILFFGLGQLQNPENKIKKAGTNSPTRSCKEERRSNKGHAQMEMIFLKNCGKKFRLSRFV